MNRTEWNKFFKENAESYLARDEGDKPFQFLRYISHYETVLDVGSGLGKIPFLMKTVRPNMEIAVCDFSDTAVEHLQHSGGLFSEAFRTDIHEINRERNSYDVVMCSEVLEHLEDPRSAVDELVRVARSKVLIGVPYKDYITDPDHVQEFDLDDIYDLFLPYGYVELSVINGHSNILGVLWLK